MPFYFQKINALPREGICGIMPSGEEYLSPKKPLLAILREVAFHVSSYNSLQSKNFLNFSSKLFVREMKAFPRNGNCIYLQDIQLSNLEIVDRGCRRNHISPPQISSGQPYFFVQPWRSEALEVSGFLGAKFRLTGTPRR
jgi:hypothetical protein